MLKARKAKVVATPAVEVPAVSAATVAAARQARYAPAATLSNLGAVITHVAPNPKRGKSAVRYDQFYKVGQTIGQVIEAYKAANLPSTLARADIRWDVRCGNITLQS